MGDKVKKDTKIKMLIFLFFVLVYFTTSKGNVEVIDTSFSIATATALIEKGNFDIGSEAKSGGTPKYSKYGPGLGFVLIPFVVAGQFLGGLLNQPLAPTLIVSFYNIFFGAGSCALFYCLIRRLGGPARISFFMTLILGLCTLSWRYSVWDFSEATQMFFLLFSILFILRGSRRDLLLASFSCAFLIIIKVVYITYVPLLLLYIFWDHCKKTDIKNGLVSSAIFSLVIISALSFLLYLNSIRFESVLEFGYGAEATKFSISGIWNNSYKLFFSINKGLFIYSPILLIGMLGYTRLVKIRKKETLLFLSLIITNLLITSMWHGWGGGWSWGPRFLVPLVPLWLLPLFLSLNKKGWRRVIIAAIIGLSFSIQLLSVLQKDHEYHHIRYNLAGKEAGNMPGDIVGSFVILKHKMVNRNNAYNLKEFGVSSNRIIDTYSFETYRGLNLWSCHLARYYNKPILKFIPLIFLPIVLYLLFEMFRFTRSEVKEPFKR
jgi:hypothetical protein